MTTSMAQSGDGTPAGNDPPRQYASELASAYSKLQWTAFLLEETRALYEEFFRLEPVRFNVQPRHESGELVFTIHAPQDLEATNAGWTAIINSAAQVIHGARCVLDHMAFAIAKFESPQAPENDLFGVNFQIMDDERRWEKQAPGRLKLLTPRTRLMMREMQVFHPGSAGLLMREGLLRLHNLDRTDRHRQLNVALIGTSTINFPSWEPHFTHSGGAVNWGPEPLDDREVATIQFDGAVPPGLPEGVHPYEVIPPSLVFLDANVTEQQGKFVITDVINTLYWILNSADAAVRRFEPLFFGKPVPPLTNNLFGV